MNFPFIIHSFIHLRFFILGFSIGIPDFRPVRHRFRGMHWEPAGWRALYFVTVFCKELKVLNT